MVKACRHIKELTMAEAVWRAQREKAGAVARSGLV